jgi:hypothetical protein
MQLLIVYLLIVVSAFMGGSAFAAEKPPAVLSPRSVLPELEDFKGTRFVQANKKGDVFVLDGQELVVYRLVSEKLKKVETLEVAVFGTEPWIRSAAMNRSGDSWLLLDKDRSRLFVRGKEKVLPDPVWSVTGVGFAGDAPLVAQAPGMIQNAASPIDLEHMPKAPLVSQLQGRKWEPYSAREHWRTAHEDNPISQTIVDSELLLTGCNDGKVWIGSHYGYRFREFSTSGRQLFEMEFPVGKSSPEPPAEEIAGATALTAKAHTSTMTCDRDGTLYVLVAPAATGTVFSGLDRYDSVTGRVDRILVDIPSTHRLSSAAGKDGIYIVSFGSKAKGGGAWLIPWEDLRDQPWLEITTEIRSGTRLTD